MKKRACVVSVCFVFSLLGAGCVIPAAPDHVISLTAEPVPVFYPANGTIFYRVENLVVKALTDDGREIIIPPESYTMTLDGHYRIDYYSLYEIRTYNGTVEYMGKSVEFSIFAYDPLNPPDGPVIVHPI
jgi:hypothetical protein